MRKLLGQKVSQAARRFYDRTLVSYPCSRTFTTSEVVRSTGYEAGLSREYAEAEALKEIVSWSTLTAELPATGREPDDLVDEPEVQMILRNVGTGEFHPARIVCWCDVGEGKSLLPVIHVSGIGDIGDYAAWELAAATSAVLVMVANCGWGTRTALTLHSGEGKSITVPVTRYDNLDVELMPEQYLELPEGYWDEPEGTP